jgi:hypothetical protein
VGTVFVCDTRLAFQLVLFALFGSPGGPVLLVCKPLFVFVLPPSDSHRSFNYDMAKVSNRTKEQFGFYTTAQTQLESICRCISSNNTADCDATPACAIYKLPNEQIYPSRCLRYPLTAVVEARLRTREELMWMAENPGACSSTDQVPSLDKHKRNGLKACACALRRNRHAASSLAFQPTGCSSTTTHLLTPPPTTHFFRSGG